MFPLNQLNDGFPSMSTAIVMSEMNRLPSFLSQEDEKSFL